MSSTRATSSGASGSALAARPLSGMFGVNKPSGPTSMALLEDLKELLAHSSLFRNADGSVPASSGGKGWRGGKRGRGKGRKAPGAPAPPKIGQGGTLDPLADGVLGEWRLQTSQMRRCRAQCTGRPCVLGIKPETSWSSRREHVSAPSVRAAQLTHALCRAVIGVGSGTKQLQRFLDCTKVSS
jgi:hypothetical protein